MVHEYNLAHIKIRVETDMDAIFMMDDWGAENNLLIPLALWRKFSKPLYKEYCNLVHKHGKYVFFRNLENLIRYYFFFSKVDPIIQRA